MQVTACVLGPRLLACSLPSLPSVTKRLSQGAEARGQDESSQGERAKAPPGGCSLERASKPKAKEKLESEREGGRALQKTGRGAWR